MLLTSVLVLTALVHGSLEYGGLPLTSKERKCLIETNADETEYNWALILPRVSYETQCALLCWFKFLGYFDENGDLLESGFDILGRRIGAYPGEEKCQNLLLLDEPDKCKLALMFAICEDKFHPLTVS